MLCLVLLCGACGKSLRVKHTWSDLGTARRRTSGKLSCGRSRGLSESVPCQGGRQLAQTSSRTNACWTRVGDLGQHHRSSNFGFDLADTRAMTHSAVFPATCRVFPLIGVTCLLCRSPISCTGCRACGRVCVLSIRKMASESPGYISGKAESCREVCRGGRQRTLKLLRHARE